MKSRVACFLKVPHHDPKAAPSLGPSLDCALPERPERKALTSPDEEDESGGN